MSLLLLFADGVLGPVEGAFAAIEATDTPSASAVLQIAANVGQAEADDVASAAGATALAGSVALTEADDVGPATAALAIAAGLAGTEGDDVPSAIGALAIVASAAWGEQDDGISAASAVDIGATLTVAEADDILTVSALMPIWHLRRGGDEAWAEYERGRRLWEDQLRQIIDRSWRVAGGEIDPVTFEPIPPPDHSAVIGGLIAQALALDRARTDVFIAEQERLQKEEAIAILLVTA